MSPVKYALGSLRRFSDCEKAGLFVDWFERTVHFTEVCSFRRGGKCSRPDHLQGEGT